MPPPSLPKHNFGVSKISSLFLCTIAKNIAVMAGATGDMINEVAERLIAESKIRVDRAKEILKELK